jgi:two-component system, chemotaxis family, protein-glutamate methylesterase/glutaminase
MFPRSAKKRVLIVDDAVVVRKTLADVIPTDPELEVAGTAANGRIALEKFPTLRPDLVLLDVEMPEMDGLETVRELRKIDRRVPIIMFSTLTERGASITLEALALGATDYVTKPSNIDVAATLSAISQDLIPRIRALCRLPDSTSAAATPIVSVAPQRKPSPAVRCPFPPEIVAIGVSTGGPDALARVIPLLPKDLPVPVVIAQHMPPVFTSLLATRLSSKSALPVREAISGDALTRGVVAIAPGDYHMVVSKEDGVTRLRTHQGPKENFCRPSVDVLFRSVASTYGGRTLAVILTGMGQDGLKGCEELRNLGARIFAQDEGSSVVWGMPGFVARAGLTEKVLPLDQIAMEITRAVTNQSASQARA